MVNTDRSGMLTHDACGTRLGGKVGRFVTAREDRLETSVCKSFLRAIESGGCWVADGHAKALTQLISDAWKLVFDLLVGMQ
jgi:hypothetical protein